MSRDDVYAELLEEAMAGRIREDLRLPAQSIEVVGGELVVMIDAADTIDAVAHKLAAMGQSGEGHVKLRLVLPLKLPCQA